MNNSKFCEEGVELEKYNEKERFILAGHFHISDIRKMGKSTAGYLGNPFQHTFADINNNKYVYVLDLENMDLKKFENEFSPRHEILRYSKKETPKRKNSIVRVIFDVPDTTEKYTSFASQIQEESTPFTLLTQTDFELKSEAEQKETNIGFEQLLEEFINGMDIESKKETLEYCSNLYKRCA
jgi:DNA repair exonuclease SbcCD nuclease subunit